MRVLEVVYNLSLTSGGPSRSVQGLAAALCENDVDVYLMTTVSSMEPWHPGLSKYINGGSLSPHGIWVAYDFKRLARATIKEVQPDIVHIHGIWNWRIHVITSICRELGIPYVISPRGALSKWALSQSWGKKIIAWHVFQRRDLKSATAIHVTSDGEEHDVQSLNLTSHIINIPNGINLPSQIPPRVPHADGKHRLLFMSRIHKVKGLIDLVRAWSEMKCNEWILEIAGGDGEGYWKTVEAEIQRLGIADRVTYSGLLRDDEKWLAYRRADCFILPSYSENFGIVVAEALYAELPVIVTKGAPWKALIDANAGYWIENGVAPITDALRHMVSLSDEERECMGRKGKAFVLRKYDWKTIGECMKNEYVNILTQCRK